MTYVIIGEFQMCFHNDKQKLRPSEGWVLV